MKVTAKQAKKQHSILADLAKRHEKDRQVNEPREREGGNRRLALQNELSQIHSHLASHRDVNVPLLARARAIRAHGIHLPSMPSR